MKLKLEDAQELLAEREAEAAKIAEKVKEYTDEHRIVLGECDAARLIISGIKRREALRAGMVLDESGEPMLLIGASTNGAGYPFKGTRRNKVLFVIGDSGRCLRSKEIKSMIREYEPSIHVKTLGVAISNLFTGGEVVRAVYSEVPQWSFYGLHKFAVRTGPGQYDFADDKYRPSPEALQGVDESSVKVEFKGDPRLIHSSRPLFAK